MEGVSIFLPFEFKAFDALPQGKILDKIDIIVFQLFVYLYSVDALNQNFHKIDYYKILLNYLYLKSCYDLHTSGITHHLSSGAENQFYFRGHFLLEAKKWKRKYE